MMISRVLLILVLLVTATPRIAIGAEGTFSLLRDDGALFEGTTTSTGWSMEVSSFVNAARANLNHPKFGPLVGEFKVQRNPGAQGMAVFWGSNGQPILGTVSGRTTTTGYLWFKRGGRIVINCAVDVTPTVSSGLSFRVTGEGLCRDIEGKGYNALFNR